MSKYVSVCVRALVPLLLSTTVAHAHAIVGNRVFPATLAVEDPGVSDEFDVKTGRFKEAGEDGEPSAWGSETEAEFSKRLTKHFALSLEGAWVGEGDEEGLDNIGLGGKYVFYENAAHEVILATGLDWDIGGSGTKHIGAERFSTFTPAVFFGKGMGDLPQDMALFKPFAVTGTAGYAIPARSFTIDDDTKERNPQALEWGFTVQYSVPYLQQHVKDIGLDGVLATAVPVVEFAFATPTGGEDSGSTTGTINPGVMFVGDQFQLGLEAQIPLNSGSGSGIGYLVQAHFYLDNIFPASLGKPVW